MKPEDVLAIAQQGNPKVIAAIINRTTEPHGLFVRIARRGSCLYVLLEGDVTERQEVLVSFMQTSLQKLQLQPINSAIIYGRQKGQMAMDWSEQIKILPVMVPLESQSNPIPPFNPSSSPSPQATPLTVKSAVNPTHETAASPPATDNPLFNPSAEISIKSPLAHLAPENEERLPDTELPDSQLPDSQLPDSQLEKDAIAQINAIALGHRSERNPRLDEQYHASEINVSVSSPVSIHLSQLPNTTFKVEPQPEQDHVLTTATILESKSPSLEIHHSQSVSPVLSSTDPILDVVDPLQKKTNTSTTIFSADTFSADTFSADTFSADTFSADTATVKSDKASSKGMLKRFKLPEFSELKRNQSPVTQQGNIEDNNQPKDVIRSDEGQLETLSLSLLSSNQDELAQEELQVGKNQQTMGTLEMSTPDNHETQLDNTETQEAIDQPPTMNYSPESITAKFNTLVAPSMESQEPGTPMIPVIPGESEQDTLTSRSEFEAVSLGSPPAEFSSTEKPKAIVQNNQGEQAISSVEVNDRDIEDTIASPPTSTQGKPLVIPTLRQEPVVINSTPDEELPGSPQNDEANTDDSIHEEQIENPDLTKGPDLDNVDLDAFIRYPEALILIFFTIAFFIWQTYLSILDEAAPEGMLTGNKLAKRLGVNPSTISRRKDKERFEEWAQSIDPDGLAWSYTDGFFVPHLGE